MFLSIIHSIDIPTTNVIYIVVRSVEIMSSKLICTHNILILTMYVEPHKVTVKCISCMDLKSGKNMNLIS